ncbi:hypothetical protein EUX98_g4012 [Antrodiella citrinella]|uniref:tRNA nucleotidyltransferase/poly(A) polymerase RNA and SrmB- binding domain-containing protein n=1 Tax=Antrodiella citrinella TaxID=2447956 RepID=A0A4S4MV09_9APHY|nr:hypothetical protein EUX98_g4012 [Antrodiella citrinella]
MGMPFAENLVEFCANVKKIEVEKIAKIESNPDRSKHLETARTTILGLELDFVNLRSEEYAEDSRIPTQVDALRHKISRERVGEEIDKMMKGRDPLRAVRLIHDLSLYDAIFHIPNTVTTELSSPPAPSHIAFAAASILHVLTETSSDSLPPLHPLLKGAISEKGARARLYLACALRPFHGITYQDRKKKILPAVDAAIRESTKLGSQNHYLDGIPILFAGADLLPPTIEAHIGSQRERVSIGLLLKDKRVHNPHTGSHWSSSLLFSLVCELVPLWDPQTDNFDVEKAVGRVDAYNAFVSRAEALDLLSTVEAKTILDGHEVVRILNAERPGPWMTDVLSRVTVWELEHPHGTKAECEEWLCAEQASGTIVVSSAPSSSARQPKVKTKRGGGADSSHVPKKAKTSDDTT